MSDDTSDDQAMHELSQESSVRAPERIYISSNIHEGRSSRWSLSPLYPDDWEYVLATTLAELEVIADAVDCAGLHGRSILRWGDHWRIEEGPGVVGEERFETFLDALLALRRWSRAATGIDAAMAEGEKHDG